MERLWQAEKNLLCPYSFCFTFKNIYIHTYTHANCDLVQNTTIFTFHLFYVIRRNGWSHKAWRYPKRNHCLLTNLPRKKDGRMCCRRRDPRFRTIGCCGSCNTTERFSGMRGWLRCVERNYIITFVEVVPHAPSFYTHTQSDVHSIAKSLSLPFCHLNVRKWGGEFSLAIRPCNVYQSSQSASCRVLTIGEHGGEVV